VIAPPYFALEIDELVQHFAAAAAACHPLPFYLYEYADRSGYVVPVSVIERLRDRATNLAGMKVSDALFERVEPYLATGLDVFIGAEAVLAEVSRMVRSAPCRAWRPPFRRRCRRSCAIPLRTGRARGVITAACCPASGSRLP
jgi:hypothetical protein